MKKVRLRARFLFAWYDLWIGFYWDRGNRTIYILPLPMIGIVITFRKQCPEKAKPNGCQLHNIHCQYPKCEEL